MEGERDERKGEKERKGIGERRGEEEGEGMKRRGEKG